MQHKEKRWHAKQHMRTSLNEKIDGQRSILPSLEKIKIMKNLKYMLFHKNQMEETGIHVIIKLITNLLPYYTS